MLRRIVATVLFLLVAYAATVTANARQAPRLAPADEYFGPFHESILGLRNRLNDFDRRSDRDMLRPGTIGAIDNVERGMLDWQHKYPEDTWLPSMLSRLIHEYHRAHGLGTARGRLALHVMMSDYPGAYVPSKKKIAAIRR